MFQLDLSFYLYCYSIIDSIGCNSLPHLASMCIFFPTSWSLIYVKGFAEFEQWIYINRRILWWSIEMSYSKIWYSASHTKITWDFSSTNWIWGRSLGSFIHSYCSIDLLKKFVWFRVHSNPVASKISTEKGERTVITRYYSVVPIIITKSNTTTSLILNNEWYSR